jgi:two-component system response regulator
MDPRPILLVEDTPDDVALTMRALRQSRIVNDVVVARDGVEALDYLQGRGPYAGRDTQILPALMLLDLKLPRLGGLEVLKQIQADPDLSSVRVVVLTTSREEEDIVASYAHGACSYVRKPVNFNDFLAAVRKLGEYWLTINESLPVETSV